MRAFIFDNETDGLINCNAIRRDRWPRVIEFCGLVYDEEGQLVDEIDTLVNSGRHVSKEVTEITGIKTEDLIGKPTLKEIWPTIKSKIESSTVVVAHNAGFDVNVLNLEATRQGLEPIEWPADIFCTVENTEHYFGRRMKLSELYEHLFKEQFKGAHRARNDVLATARCYFEIVKKK